MPPLLSLFSEQRRVGGLGVSGCLLFFVSFSAVLPLFVRVRMGFLSSASFPMPFFSL
ncbi:hypothetical protein HMPREF9141_2513 [Prevotella multiformis DSM 16608]|uniref:Transmembrane protein n=1 Tax=Prevotella multiformis DSM 16608 TaxID=888743 RepID=F0FA96_9BACT|nr:hypothetical protein HMPREF9141_2513 [Prevotella multiformis DSM 16608]